VKTGGMDAAIVWDATAAQYPKLKAIRTEELDAGTSSITIGVLTSSDHPTEALRFARFVGARDQGLKKFAENGFEVVDGDIWEEEPKLTFFAGAVNRRALEPIIRRFSLREGVEVKTSFNGCGILTGQMKLVKNQDPATGFPDIFMACDIYYLEQVQDWFGEGVNVSDTDIVIAVPKNNPAQIESIEDLAKPGVRLAVGHEDQCTIGVLTQHLLKTEDARSPGFYEAVKKNVVTQTPSSAMLVPSVIAKSDDADAAADATLAYRTDCQAEKGKIKVIPIDSPAAKAIQPYSIAKTSQKKHLARRLYEAIARSRGDFENAGFNWRLNGDADNRP
jgi:molybdate transport system substrate-binding protein